ncbi:MAG: Nudix family hydrolase [Gammaproteobacteria bacterium]
MTSRDSSSFVQPVHVAVAAIVNERDEVLVARRPQHVHQGGLWEFPGGKVEAGETVEQALAREIDEELGLQVTAARPLIRIEHRYPDKAVCLHVWRVDRWQGRPSGREGQPLEWVAARALDPARFPAANRAIVRALQLPDHYLITPEPTADREGFLDALGRALAHGVRLVQLRAKASPAPELDALVTQSLALCRRHGGRLLVHASAGFSVAAAADGVHLDSATLMALTERPLGPDRWVAASCHHTRQLEHAVALGLDFAVVSPVAATASHPQARPIGWDGLAALTEVAAIPVYALGGLGPADVATAQRHGAQGIAAIRGLWEQDDGSTA